MDKEIGYFLSQWGEPQHSKPVDEATLKQFNGQLPDALLGYWQKYGFAGYHHGLLWMVNPAEYEHALESWIGNTPVMERDAYHVIARSAFGKLYLWGRNTGERYTIDPQTGVIYERNYGNPKDFFSKKQREQGIALFWNGQDFSMTDELDADAEPMFMRALEKLGPCGPDEMYAFSPAPFIGGARNIAYLEKVNIHVQLDLLAQFGHKEFLDFAGMQRKAFG